MEEQRFHIMGDERRIAFRLHQGRGPAIVFLPGYMSDMEGTKAGALFESARAQGRSCLLFDYSGCGRSTGDFSQGTLSRWRDEARALIDAHCPGPVILVGSSLGGWLMVLLGEDLGPRLAGMVGIAVAPDFTRWDFEESERARLEAGETLLRPNPYGSEPTPFHPGFFADAEGLMVLDRPIAIRASSRLLHGQRDEDVPWEVSLALAERLCSDDVHVTLVKDGDHRLSRPQDIALIEQAVFELAESGANGGREPE